MSRVIDLVLGTCVARDSEEVCLTSLPNYFCHSPSRSPSGCYARGAQMHVYTGWQNGSAMALGARLEDASLFPATLDEDSSLARRDAQLSVEE